MNLQTVKTVDQITLAGIETEFVKENNSLKEVILRDMLGNVVALRSTSEYADIKVLIPAEPEKVDRYLLSGKFGGLVDVKEYFDDSFAASQRKLEFDRQSAGGDSGLTVEKVQVMVSERGEIIEDMPF